MIIKKEVWRTVPTLKEWQVSNRGRIRNRLTKIVKRSFKLSNKHPYPCVRIDKKCRLIHRMVLSAFRGESSLQVNHKNGVKTNCQLANLEYVTPSQNVQHAYDTGLNDAVRAASSKAWRLLHKSGLVEYSKGTRHYAAKLNGNSVRKIRKLFLNGLNNHEIGKIFKVARATVCQIRAKKTWKHIK